jgi:hypothetical protein
MHVRTYARRVRMPHLNQRGTQPRIMALVSAAPAPASAPPPACKDCLYFRPDPVLYTPHLVRCAHPASARVEPVLRAPLLPYARDARAPGAACGPSGARFVPEPNPAARLLRGRGAWVAGAVGVGLWVGLMRVAYS